MKTANLRCLFISTHSVLDPSIKSGGSNLTRSNYEALSKYYEINEMHSLKATSSFFYKSLRVIFSLFGFLAGNNPWFMNNVLKKVNEFKPSFVFIDHSQLGLLAKQIKENFPDCKVIISFQNIESLYFKNSLNLPKYLGFLFEKAALKNEKTACKYSDRIITLTLEDSKNLLKYYGRLADKIIPISLKINEEIKSNTLATNIKPYLLFCGSYFPPNIDGLKWFVENVLNFISFELIVIGFQMEKLKKELYHPKLKIIGTVNSLDSYYQMAIAVVNPVRIGSGMNTKSVEAICYGKKLISTPFALTGFPRPLINSIATCENAEEFVREINSLTGEESLFDLKTFNYAKSNFTIEVRAEILKLIIATDKY